MSIEPTRIDQLPEGWGAAEVFYYKTIDGKKEIVHRYETIDNRDPKNPIRYIRDKVDELAIKCFLMMIGLPFYTMGVMVAQALRGFTLTIFSLIKRDISEAFFSLVQQILNVVKAPFFCIAFEFCVLAGIFFPVPMRPVIAELERAWSGSERGYDLRKSKGEAESSSMLADFFTNRNSKTTTFFAFCFQPIGRLRDESRVFNVNPILAD